MKYLLIFLILILFSCSREHACIINQFPTIEYHLNEEKRVIVYATVLEKVLKENFKNANIQLNDNVYAIPSVKWLKEYNKSFVEYYKKFKYNKSYDCDNYSITYHSNAQELHAYNKYWGVEGLGIGKIFYYQQSLKIPLTIAKEQIKDKDKYNKLEKDDQYVYIRQGHAINIVIIDSNNDENGFELIFVEPQNGKQIIFTKEDIDTVFFIEF